MRDNDLYDLLWDLLGFLDDYADILDGEDSDGRPRPNQAMRLMTEVQWALDTYPFKLD